MDETGEFYQLALKLNWKVKYQDNELVLSKSDDYLTLKLKLDFEYTHQNIRHYVVEDIEIDTKKGKFIYNRLRLSLHVIAPIFTRR